MDFFSGDAMATPLWLWGLFLAIVLGVLIVDLGFVARRYRVLSLSQSVVLTVCYSSLAVAFGIVVLFERGTEAAALFFTALVLEQSLSIDNVFVMSVVFAYFAVPRDFQHRVLFWGILVAMVLRGIFVVAGAAIVSHFEWLLFIFGAFLIITGVRMVLHEESGPDLSSNGFLRFMQRRLRVSKTFDGERFFTRQADENGVVRSYATPLFLAFMVINVADIVFAVDSVPAVLAMTQDPFIVYTSNIFAILGLRALYFVIAAMIDRFHYLRYALSFLLVFIGLTIFYKAFIGHVPPLFSLSVTILTIATALIASLTRRTS